MLTRKDIKQQQEEKQQKTFNKLGGIFTTRLVLAALDLNKEFRIKVNALNCTTKKVLLIKYSNKLQRLVAFISKSQSDTERNYKIYNKEMLVVVRCLEVQKHFLEETTIKFEIWKDHKNLGYFIKV